MNNYDFICLCKVFQRLENKNLNELVTFENTYQVFKQFDEFDLLSLLEIKIYRNVLNQVQRDILATCDYLLRFNREDLIPSDTDTFRQN